VTQVWLVRCGVGGRYVRSAVEHGLITIDFREAGDVRGLTVDQIASQLTASTTRSDFHLLARMVYAFANQIRIGDLIVTSDRARRLIAIGRVVGPYEWLRHSPIPDQHHALSVDWIGERGWDDLTGSTETAVLSSQGTVLLFPDQDEVLALIEGAVGRLGPSESRRVSGIHAWWEQLADERCWMEITDRADLGVDLNAPQWKGTITDHAEYWSYSLIKQIEPGDLVFHFFKPEEAIVGWSIATGDVWEDEVFWGAQGTSARLAGNTPVLRPGWRLGIENFTPLTPALPLSEIRRNEPAVLAVRDAHQSAYGKPTYFPFTPYKGQPLRTVQAYLAKFPSDLTRLFPQLRVATAIASQVEREPPTKPTSGTSSSELGLPYRVADEAIITANPDPFGRDPALVERALQGHARTQNELARYVEEHGYMPRSPAPFEPDFDLAWEADGIRFVAEVKSITDRNEEKQLRLGLGQVLRYAQILSAAGTPTNAVLAVERQPRDASWPELCEVVGVQLVWRGGFHRVNG
jgi:hypothetical protein